MMGYTEEELLQIKNFMILKDFVKGHEPIQDSMNLFELQNKMSLNYLKEYLTSRIHAFLGLILTEEEQNFLINEIMKRIAGTFFEDSSILVDFSILGLPELRTKMIFGMEYLEEEEDVKKR